MDEYCRETLKRYKERGHQGRFEVEPDIPSDERVNCKRKFEDEEVTMLRCAFFRKNYALNELLPKAQLTNWTHEQRHKMPTYETIQEYKLFRSIVTVDGRQYGSSYW